MKATKQWLRPLQDFILHFIFATLIIFFVNQRFFIPGLKNISERYGIEPAYEQFLQEFLGDGQSLPVRYWHYLKSLLTLDFELLDKDVFVEALVSTSRLLLVSGLLALLIGIGFGVVWGWTSRKVVSNVNYTLSVLLRSFPPYVIVWAVGPMVLFNLTASNDVDRLFSQYYLFVVIAAAIYPAGLIMMIVRNALNDLAFEIYIQKSLTPETNKDVARLIGKQIANALLKQWRFLFTVLITAVLVSESFYPASGLTVNLGSLIYFSMFEDFLTFQSAYIILTAIWPLIRLIEQYAILLLNRQKQPNSANL